VTGIVLLEPRISARPANAGVTRSLIDVENATQLARAADRS
jgi:hypothetical protein